MLLNARLRCFLLPSLLTRKETLVIGNLKSNLGGNLNGLIHRLFNAFGNFTFVCFFLSIGFVMYNF